MQNMMEIALRTSAWENEVWCFSLFLPLGSARRAALPVLFLLTSRFWGFSPRRGDTLHRSRWNLARRVRSFQPNFTWSVQGWSLRPTKLWKISNFTNIPQEAGHLLYSYKIYRVYARPHSWWRNRITWFTISDSLYLSTALNSLTINCNDITWLNESSQLISYLSVKTQQPYTLSNKSNGQNCIQSKQAFCWLIVTTIHAGCK